MLTTIACFLLLLSGLYSHATSNSVARFLGPNIENNLRFKENTVYYVPKVEIKSVAPGHHSFVIGEGERLDIAQLPNKNFLWLHRDSESNVKFIYQSNNGLDFLANCKGKASMYETYKYKKHINANPFGPPIWARSIIEEQGADVKCVVFDNHFCQGLYKEADAQSIDEIMNHWSKCTKISAYIKNKENFKNAFERHSKEMEDALRGTYEFSGETVSTGIGETNFDLVAKACEALRNPPASGGFHNVEQLKSKTIGH